MLFLKIETTADGYFSMAQSNRSNKRSRTPSQVKRAKHHIN
jgi:hypothetical protein